MKIYLSKIGNDGLIIDEKISFDETYINNTSIKKLDNVSVKGRIYYDYEMNLMADLTISGNMLLEDAIDLSDIVYPFETEISEMLELSGENFEKSQNTLDITDILWQNIVLEIPIRAVKKENENISLSGDGWELVNSEKKNIDSRMAPLLELLEEGKED